jgi:hypothetical protein
MVTRQREEGGKAEYVLSAGRIEEDDDKLQQALTNVANRLVGRKAVNKTGTSSIKMARMTASFQTNLLLRVRNECIRYVVSIDRTKPNNSVRINPATRHPETKYGFVILARDMIFKYFFVGVELLLRHERLSSTAAIATKIN